MNNLDASSASVVVPLIVNGIIGTVVLCIFERVRSNREIYAPRTRLMKNACIEPATGILAWVKQTIDVSDDETLRIAGMDGYVFLRFLRMYAMVGAVCSIGTIFLLPSYGTSYGNDGVQGIDTLSMANVVMQGNALWASFVFTYIFTFVLLYFLHKEYENFVNVRRLFFKKGDETLPVQMSYSVIVENVPKAYRCSKELKKFFQNLFGDDVLHASIAVNIKPLDQKIAERNGVRAQLEKAVAAMEAHEEKERPLIKVKPGKEDEPAKPSMCGGEKVDAIDYWTGRLDELNAEVYSLQEEAAAVAVLKPQRETKSTLLKAANQNERDSIEGRNTDVSEGNEVSEGDIAAMNVATTAEAQEAEYGAVDDQSDEGDEGKQITRKMVTATGFVTFSSRRAQATACQVPVLSEPFPMVMCRPAPAPKNMVWNNIGTTPEYIEKATNFFSNFYYLGLLFWGLILAFIASISTLSNLAFVLPFVDALDPSTKGLIEGLLPVVALIVFISLLATIMTAVSTYGEKRKTTSDIQIQVFRWFFLYQLANVFLILLAGSIFDSLNDAISNPGSIITLIGSAVPTVVIFFLNFVLTQLLVSIPLMMLRIVPLIIFQIYTGCFKQEKLTRRALVEGPFNKVTVNYGTTLPSVLYIFCIMVIYWVIAPLVLLAATVYFAALYVAWKYQYLFVVTKEYESGGEFFYGMYGRSMTALMAGTITMTIFMGIKVGIIQTVLLIPLNFMVVSAWNYTEGKFKRLSMHLPYSSARDIDFGVGSTDNKTVEAISEFTEDFNKQPNMVSPKIFTYPYRIEETPLLNEKGCLSEQYHADIPEGQDNSHLYSVSALGKETEMNELQV